MKKVVVIFLTGIILLWSCGDRKKSQIIQREAKGDVAYGGVFRMNEVEDFRNLFPLSVTEVTSHRITNQIYEGLVGFSQKDLSVIPGIAERWDINDSATSFTFYLRKGVKFHDDPCFADAKGREVTANDFKYCFTKLCEATSDNQMFWVFKNRVVGADEYYNSTLNGKPLKEGVTGVKVIDDYTIQIDLKYSFAGLMNILGHNACWVYPKEAYDKYGTDMRVKCVGTGPFKVKTIKEGQAVILERNPNYWKYDEHGNQLPYLDALKFTFLKEKKTELFEFKNGNLDMIFTLPLEMIDDVIGELEEAKKGGNIPFEIQVTPSLSIQYYGFLFNSKIFNNIKVRQAFNYAINKKSIVTYTLQGEGKPALNGIIPPAFKYYEKDSIEGYLFNPELAKKLFAEAGYPDGKGFPPITLQLNSGGANNIQIAEVIQKMLEENLGIKINLDVVPFAQHLENVETGKVMFWRSGWVADYPDPENFLNLFYSPHIPENSTDKSYINPFRYKNEKFDALFDAALREVNEKKRYELYQEADRLIVHDAVVIPLYYEEFTRLLKVNVKNFPANAMEYRILSEVYFKEEKEKSVKEY